MPVETLEKRKQRTALIIRILNQTYPNARTALTFHSPLELLVATILSAQCTDKRVNMVTQSLFKKYPRASSYSAVHPEEFEQEIKSTGFYRNKTRAILGAMRKIADEFHNEVPDTMEDLITLPGVARKTANVVLGNAFGKNEGIVVDTHVTRLSQRLHLTRHKDNSGDKIEKDLMVLVAHKEWTGFGNRLIMHGRLICRARRTDCRCCVISSSCPSAFKIT